MFELLAGQAVKRTSTIMWLILS